MSIPAHLAAVIYAAQPYDSFSSSNIKSFTYHYRADTLIVDFLNGSSYSYSNVPEQVVVDFAQAPSKGRYHAAHVKYNFPYTRL